MMQQVKGSRANKYYRQLKIQSRRNRSQGLGLHRLSGSGLPSLKPQGQWRKEAHKARMRQVEAHLDDRSQHVHLGPRTTGERIIIFMLLLVLSFICFLPVLAFLKWVF